MTTAKKILFVDDEADQRFMLASYFKLAGYDLVTAESADQAVRLVEKTPFDCIILDVNLADLTGHDGSNLLVALKRKHPGAPIILYTGLGKDDAEVIDMLNLGADHFLSKGGSPEELLKLVKKMAK